MRPVRLMLVISAMAYSNYVGAQHLELSAQISSGLFYYGGPSATHSTLTDISYPPAYIRNPYGQSPGLSYGVSLQLQKTTATNFLYGLQTGFEVLTSKVRLYEVLSEEPVYHWNTAKSFITLSDQFINLSPFIGHRIHKEKLTLDLLAGTDIGLCLNSRAKIDVTSSTGDRTVIKTEREKINVDIRPRIGVTGFYKQYGISMSYSLGLSDYSKTLPQPDHRIYSRYLRIGFVYRLGS